MPKDFNTKQAFDESYRIGAEPGGHPAGRREVKLGYCRAVMLPYARARAGGIVAAMGWDAPWPRLVIVGGSFGWLGEMLETEHGFTQVVSTDVSRYVQAEKDNTEEADIDAALVAVGLDPTVGEGAMVKGRLFDGGNRTRASRGVVNENLKTGGSRNRVKNLLGGGVDWVLSENVLENLADAEVVTASAPLRQLGAGVVHLITPLRPGQTQDPDFNWKTLEGWKVLLPADTIVEIGSFRVL